MSAAAPPAHPALEPAGGTPLAEARVTDQGRLAVLLQGGSLLAHLDLSGHRLADGWTGARIDREGVLRALRAERGRAAEMPQRLMTELSRRLFGGERRPAGRGEARRAARELAARWARPLVPLPADLAVEQLLESAPFLWRRRHGAARASLAALHFTARGEAPWVAGPAWLRRPLLADGRSLDGLRRRLASAGPGRLWERRQRPATDPDGRLAEARRAMAAGRFELALEHLRRLRRASARALRARCQAGLGGLAAARRTLGGLERARLTAADLLEAAETAVAVYTASGDRAGAERWMERARRSAPEALRPRFELLACAADWHLGDDAALDRRLARARPALAEPGLGWRWRQLAALAALARGDVAGAASELRRALAGSRRRLTPAEASSLWNELGLTRARGGELAGAERAFRHAVRLLDRAQGPRQVSVALFNLAEIRLRRGRPHAVADLAKRVAAADRRAGNWRAWAHDEELRVRCDLVRGRLGRARRRAEAAAAELERRGLGRCRPQLAAFEARALGWQRRPREARRRLEAIEGRPLEPFEPEELAALWALAGRPERARRAACGDTAAIWRAVLAGRQVEPEEWRALDRLEPYRAARCVLDVELAEPGAAPAELRRRSAETLRRVGAERLAARLEGRMSRAWLAVAGYLGDAECDAARLLAEAGYPEARLTWVHEGRCRTIAPGRDAAGGGISGQGGLGEGGDERLEAPLDGGILRLESPRLDGAQRALFALLRRDLRPADESPRPDGEGGVRIVGSSAALRRVLERLPRLAAHDLPVLVTGETGTGKELVARRVHALSRRAGGAFLAINCAALPEPLLLSDLFGHARGSFTGADRDRVGVFESAAGGTVFLDEIGDLPAAGQGTLLRVLQEGELRRVGESRVRRVDARVVAATHADLEALVAAGRFREDLFFRLRVATVELPPLRERGRDVLLLARHFLERQPGAPRLELTAEARERLLAHDWPGNVRELENRIAVAAAMAEGRVLDARALDLEARGPRPTGYHRRVEDFRRNLVREALEASGGNRAAAARRLGLSRQALTYLVRRLEID